MIEPIETPWEGRFIAVKKQGKWEYVSRTRGIQAAVILAIDRRNVILVEQYRVPLGQRCLELPAGLVGDEEEGESVELSAFDPDSAIEDPVRWLATVVRMDGRRIDLLELIKLGHRGEGGPS